MTTTGPERFAPSNDERTIQEQISSLTEKERECFENLKAKWSNRTSEDSFDLDDKMILRFAYCSPGSEKFNEKTAWKVMEKFERRFLELKAVDLEEQLMSKTLFPIPGLKTLEGGHDVFYMRPSRYFPKKTTTEAIVNNLGYCMTSMQDGNEKNTREGIGFVANMDDWKMENFSFDYCLQFMNMLQGKIPVRVRMFLIVNPPGWFGTIWSIMKPMLSKDFRKKVNVIPEAKLSKYLSEGFEDFLPDEFAGGRASTDDIVKDFVAYRKSIE
eukprot:CAMPEP_0197193024 /NCGR_PEP_ID=MMETSP1423-20130617/26276_1 /TAXON_ID=476441 /ORGANISM="Pseudo-nitzschia heimii, Strain UNC1101" /LENGTH=269 /DNA_ID=CAMNT_0042646073 /DNA_START=85 /DNA_END=894 /DNA_ORIENTATION=+